MSNATRKAAVRGLFYPQKCIEVKSMIETFKKNFQKTSIPKELKNIIPKAIIVPHAGYIYSGFTAHFAYAFLKRTKAKRFIVIGPSHHQHFKGLSGSYYKYYETPCGNLEIDSPYLFALAKEFDIGFEPKAHEKEHSTEVQMPFIEHYFPEKKVIELIYGNIKVITLAKLITALLQNKDNVLVISSDLSHFHSLEKANILDQNCLKGIANLDLNEIKNSCEACGLTGMKAIILAVKQQKLTSKLLDYRTSADTSNNKNSVVGYMSAMFY